MIMNVEHQVFWSPGVTLEQMEKEVIVKAYRFFRNNKTATASSLGISVKTLDNKLERYEMEEIEAEARKEDLAKDAKAEIHRARWGTGDGETKLNGFVNNSAIAVPVNHKGPVDVSVKHAKRK
jgi:ribonucleotide reductase alpha subunit